jgi:transcriptional regulator with XRE-family HTH domain
MIGHRLKRARAAAGLSLRDLQANMGTRVTAHAIGTYERDASVPGSRVLLALSDALGVALDSLVGDQAMVLAGVEFRTKHITRQKDQARVQARALHVIERDVLVEDILALPSAAWDQPREAPSPVHELADAD